MGFCITAGIHVAIILVIGWVTVIDGGKNHATPLWMKWFGRFSYVGIYFSEMVGGYMEYRVGKVSEREMATDGYIHY